MLPSPPRRPWGVAHFLGEIARPFSILATSGAAAWAVVVTAYRVQNGSDGAMLMTAVFVGLGALYWGKAFEVTKTTQANATVAAARAAAPAQAVPDCDDGELPPEQRVAP